jgi:transposase
MRTDIYAPKKSPELVALVRKLHDQGMSNKKVAAKVGISEMTVRAWLDPTVAQRHREKNGHGVQTHKSNSRVAQPSRLFAVDSRDKAEIMRQAIELKTRGYRAQAIAALLRVPYRAVEEALR